MGVIKEKMVVKMRIEGTAVSHARTDVSTRGLTRVIDEPLERGGTNLGMSPTETLIAALVACTNVISHKIAYKNGIALTSMKIAATVDFDRRGVTLAEEAAVPFPAITMTIDVVTTADSAQMDQLRTELAMYCPLSKVVRASGTVLTELWNVTHDQPAGNMSPLRTIPGPAAVGCARVWARPGEAALMHKTTRAT